MTLTLAAAEIVLKAALAHARAQKFKPLGIAVLDARGALKAYAAEDGTSLRRFDIAHGKAYGALALGVGTRALNKMAVERPHFMAAASGAIGTLIPVPGGVLARTADGVLMGAVGVSGDTSDNDEAAALAGIAAAGLVGDGGAG
jgi:uncharacterized protein GlcG (DUF336 family)